MKIILLILLIFIATFNVRYLLASEEDNVCILYDEEDDIIELCAGTFNIDKLASLVDDKLLYKEDNAWVLNSSLSIGSGSRLYLTKDVDWLKISKENHIEVRGEMVIDGIKITSWDTRRDDYVESMNKHRAHIVVIDGSLKIINSFIGYLGYDAGRSHGLDFYSGTDHQIINTTITGNYFGVYTDKVDSMLIMNSKFYNNYVYGIDLHTYSKNIRIINNTIYSNGYHGVICSRLCSNIEIINNTIYNNIGHGIMLDKNVTDSRIDNNIISNNDAGIMLLASSYNDIINNTINNNKHGIRVSYGSSYNTISNNIVDSSRTYGIYILKDANNNTIDSNVIKNADDAGIYIDSSRDIIISNNNISSSNYNVRVRDAEILLIDNRYYCNEPCFFLDSNNYLLHSNDNLYNITYNAKRDNIVEIIDDNNYIYSNNMNIYQTISNNTRLVAIIDELLRLDREDIRVYADNPITLLYNDGVIDISTDAITTITIEGIDNYHITDYINRDDNSFIIAGRTMIYSYDCNNVLEIRMDKYFEVCSLNDIIMQLSNYLYSINTVIAILIGFSIFSFIMIIRK